MFNKESSLYPIVQQRSCARTFFWLGLFALLLLLPRAQAAVGDRFTDENFTYTILTEEGTAGTVSVSKQSCSIPFGDVRIPEMILNGEIIYSVTTVQNNAFYYCMRLTSVVIPDSVVLIEMYAFNGCGGLVSVVIPNTVTSIEMGAFTHCGGLVSVVIPDSVATIGNSAFRSCTSLASVVIGDGVTLIGNNAFGGCASLTSVYFKGNAPSLGIAPFLNCYPTIYYVKGTAGWTNPWGERPTATWVPKPELPVIEVAPEVEVDAETGAMVAFTIEYPTGSTLEWSTNLKEWYPLEEGEAAAAAESGSYRVDVREGPAKFFRIKQAE